MSDPGQASPPAPRRWQPSPSAWLVAAALFVPRVVEGVYFGTGRPVPAPVSVLASLALFASLAAWFWSYSRSQRLDWVMDMGLFLLVAWPVVIPYYVLKREGWRGLLRLGLFLVTYLAAWAAGIATAVWARLLLGAE